MPPVLWPAVTTPRMLVGSMPNLSALVDVLTLLPGGFAAVSHDANYTSALQLMVPAAFQAAPPLVQAHHGRRGFRRVARM